MTEALYWIKHLTPLVIGLALLNGLALKCILPEAKTPKLLRATQLGYLSMAISTVIMVGFSLLSFSFLAAKVAAIGWFLLLISMGFIALCVLVTLCKPKNALGQRLGVGLNRSVGFVFDKTALLIGLIAPVIIKVVAIIFKSTGNDDLPVKNHWGESSKTNPMKSPSIYNGVLEDEY